jgi:Mg-chelatase subunit ChlD
MSPSRRSSASAALRKTDHLKGLTARQQNMLIQMNADVAEWRFEGGMSWYVGHSPDREHDGKLVNVRTRVPTPVEQKAAHELAMRVDRVSVSGDSVTNVPSVLPPGRVRASQVMQQRIQLANGRFPTARPYAKREVAHAPRTPIKVGFLLDISASMARPAALGAALSWVVAEAVARVDGKVACVAWSRGHYGLVAPGERSQRIIEVTTVGGFHDIESGLLMADAALDLIDGDGARILVVFSDGQFSDREYTPYLAEAVRAGVTVVFVTDDGLPMQIPGGIEQVDMDSRTTLTDLVQTIGDTIVTATQKHKRISA